jgi:hypothetical protein
VTRLDREQASRAAASMDLGPFVRLVALLVVVGLAVFAARTLVPSARPFGGPLQGPVVGSTSFTTIGKTGGQPVSLVVQVPWNAGTASAILDRVVPIGAEGVRVKRIGVVPPGGVALQTQRGFPPEGVTLLPVDGYTAAPGVGDLDGFQVVVGLTGEGTVTGFALLYRVGGTSQVALLPDGAMLCADACPDRDEAEDRHRAEIAELGALVTEAER